MTDKMKDVIGTGVLIAVAMVGRIGWGISSLHAPLLTWPSLGLDVRRLHNGGVSFNLLAQKDGKL